MKLKTNVDYKEIGKRVRTARELKKLSQEDLGEMLGGYSTTAISLYEQGERKISLELLSLIAEKLHITLQELVEGYTEDTPSIQVALRADKDLQNDTEIQSHIIDYIEFLKKRRQKK